MEKDSSIYGGVWQITGIREGDTWDETDELVGAVYEMLPESCSYKSKTWSYTVELGGYEASQLFGGLNII